MRTRTAPRKLASRENGFSLVELLVVVAIIMLLLAIMLPKFTSAIVAAKQGRTLMRLNQFRTAITLFAMDHGDLGGVTTEVLGGNQVALNYPERLVHLVDPLHPPKIVYIQPWSNGVTDKMPPEECTFVTRANACHTCDYCQSNGSHEFCKYGQKLEPTSNLRGRNEGAGLGGWNYCRPDGTWPTIPSSGTVWIDEDVKLFNGWMACQM